MTAGRNVVIPKEFHEEIRKISQETGDTIRTVTAAILSRAKEKSLFSPSMPVQTKESKSLNSDNIPEGDGNPSDKIDKTPEEIKKDEEDKIKENIGKGEDNPIPKDKEKKMQEQDLEAVKQIVDAVKDGINAKLANLTEKIETVKANPGTETKDSAEKAPSFTIQDVMQNVERALDKRDIRTAETEAARLRKADDAQKLKDTEEVRKKNEQRLVTLECSLNPEKPECKALMKLLGAEVVKVINPEEKGEDDDGRVEEPPKGEVKTAEQVIADVVNGLKLPAMKKEVREKMKPEEIEGRTTDAAKLLEQLNVTPVDTLNVLKMHPDDKKGIAIYVAGDPELAEEVLKRADVKAKIEGCNLGDEKQCVLADEILNENNLALVKKAEKGKRYHFVNPKLDKGTGF